MASRLVAFGALCGLAGCASAYRPPVSGPVATLNVALAIGKGNGVLSFDRSPGVLVTDFDHLGTILEGNAKKQAQTTVQIAADRDDFMIYQGFLNGGMCTVRFILPVRPGKTYLILAGNEPPLPLTGSFFDKVGQSFIRGSGVCYARSFVKGVDGQFLPLKMKRG